MIDYHSHFLYKYIFNSSFVENVHLLTRLNQERTFQVFNKNPNREEWTYITPITFTAGYHVQYNEISKTSNSSKNISSKTFC